MKTLSVTGGSDDLIEAEGIEGADEFYAAFGTALAGTMTVKAGGKTIKIHALYSGSWAFAICPQDGDYDEMPDWPIRRSFGDVTPYSETLEIDLPDDAVMEFQKP